MDLEEKWLDIGVIITGCILIAIFGVIVWVLVDFKNDYDCSTTTDIEWYEEHNCIRYCKECKNEKANR